MLAACGLVALTLLLFAMEWRTLAALEAKTAHAVRQDLRQAAETVVRGMYAYLEAESRALHELDHRTLHRGDSQDLAGAVERAMYRTDVASAVFVVTSCGCPGVPQSVARERGGSPRPIPEERAHVLRSAARRAHPLPFSNRRDLWIAPAADGGVLVFQSLEPNVVGFEVPLATWQGKVLADVAKRTPELEFSIASAGEENTADFGPALGGARLSAGYRGMTVAGLTRKQFRMQLGMVAVVLGSIAFGVVFTLRGLQKEARFLAQMSHEMKTPLATIHLFAETLEMGRVASSEKRETYLRRIREEAERLAGMIGDMLHANGPKRYRMAPENAETIAGEAMRDFEIARLRIEGGELPPIRCDRDAVSRALRNLLSNAVKYGADSPVELRVARSNGHVLFSVADRGIGIARDQQRRIFDRFYRVDDSIPGSGLGLAIAREIVRAHRGEIRVESAPGKGSTFTIALPAASEEACQRS
jgi:two-component system phosphate regulon sensor histidine kinase PhoR